MRRRTTIFKDFGIFGLSMFNMFPAQLVRLFLHETDHATPVVNATIWTLIARLWFVRLSRSFSLARSGDSTLFTIAEATWRNIADLRVTVSWWADVPCFPELHFIFLARCLVEFFFC